jgi:hypothetical protein
VLGYLECWRATEQQAFYDFRAAASSVASDGFLSGRSSAPYPHGGMDVLASPNLSPTKSHALAPLRHFQTLSAIFVPLLPDTQRVEENARGSKTKSLLCARLTNRRILEQIPQARREPLMHLLRLFNRRWERLQRWGLGQRSIEH